MEDPANVLQMMADLYKDTLKMERVEVVVSDHMYFQQNPSAAVTYQHPNIYVHPKWQERSTYTQILNDMERVMVEAKLVRGTNQATLPAATQDEPPLTRRQRILGKIEVHFVDEESDDPIAILDVPAGTNKIKIRIGSSCLPFFSYKEGLIWILPEQDVRRGTEYQARMGLSEEEIKRQANTWDGAWRYPEKSMEGYIRCDNCGTQNVPRSDYCDECGMKFPTPVKGKGRRGGNRY